MINKIKDWDNLEETEVIGNKQLPVGIYVCKIVKVINVPEKEYFKVCFDIVDGEFKDYFTGIAKNVGSWPNQGVYYASYKESAIKFLKAFITAVQKSNTGYMWDWDETKLEGKKMVVVMGEEEYDADGEIKTSVKYREIRSIDAYSKGEIKVPSLKKLKKPLTPLTDGVSVNLDVDSLF